MYPRRSQWMFKYLCVERATHKTMGSLPHTADNIWYIISATKDDHEARGTLAFIILFYIYIYVYVVHRVALRYKKHTDNTLI